MTRAPMSDAEAARIYSEAYDWRGAVEDYVFEKYAPKPRLERDPSQPIGLPCPECGHRPALRGNNPARVFTPGDDPFSPWSCSGCGAEFTLADVLRYLWNRSNG